ncbi:Glyoxylase [Phaffia rhodozyma]|uniref:Glyoxylase n=1 Tax=Phaffia rhodozyma TaxID=264483 RepID=A0A0F7SUP3_PHARH|nr:Glyoxylase [Phaffia rhodozyma]
MSNLTPIEPITQISHRIIRILGQNPGRFTLQGTNTYLVGNSSPYVLIDTGEGKSAYLPLLISSLGPEGSISDIIITHMHKDHWGGLAGVLGLLTKQGKPKPKIWKWKNPETDAAIVKSVPEGSYEPSEGSEVIHFLANNQIFTLGETILKVIHTPGHTEDSICLQMDDGSIFTADSVLGESTAVFGHLRPYLDSLRQLSSLSPTSLYPGHGIVILNGLKTLEDYITHRQIREDQIMSLLQRQPSGPEQGTRLPGAWESKSKNKGEGGWSVEELVLEMYADVGFVLQNAAARGVILHLEKLLDEGKIKKHNRTKNEEEWVLAH